MCGLVIGRSRPARPASSSAAGRIASARGPRGVPDEDGRRGGHRGRPGSALRFDESQLAVLPAVQHADGSRCRRSGIRRSHRFPVSTAVAAASHRQRLHVITRRAHDTRPFAVFGRGGGIGTGSPRQRRLAPLACDHFPFTFSACCATLSTARRASRSTTRRSSCRARKCLAAHVQGDIGADGGTSRASARSAPRRRRR